MTDKEWNTFDATMVCEGCPELAGLSEDDLTQELVLSAWQHLINTGTCWSLQGFFGRQAQALIDAGHCEPAS